jgi:hypothetical protein
VHAAREQAISRVELILRRDDFFDAGGDQLVLDKIKELIARASDTQMNPYPAAAK